MGSSSGSKWTRFQNLVENYLGALEKTGVLEELRKRWLEGKDWNDALP